MVWLIVGNLQWQINSTVLEWYKVLLAKSTNKTQEPVQVESMEIDHQVCL